MAMEFDVKAVIEREKEVIASTRDLLNADSEEEEEDEDFEEEEEEEGDIVIDDIEELKKSIKRDSPAEEEAKRQKLN